MVFNCNNPVHSLYKPAFPPPPGNASPQRQIGDTSTSFAEKYFPKGHQKN